MTEAASEQVELAAVAGELRRLEQRLLEVEHDAGAALTSVPDERRVDARNLLHYLALRRADLRDLQWRLAELGLSSLGRSESCVCRSVLAVSRRVQEALAQRSDGGTSSELKRLEQAELATPSWEDARSRLHRHTRELLGSRPDERHVYIMVTAPSAREADRAWMLQLLDAGMNVLRINCAHEGPEEWAQVVRALEEARGHSGKPCRLLMDLAGPKIRTGAIADAERVATWKPSRDDKGHTLAPAQVRLRRASALDERAATALLWLSDDEFRELRAGDELRFSDARGKQRRLELCELGPELALATADKRAYVKDETRAELLRGGQVRGKLTLRVVAEAAAVDVRTGDELLLTAREVEGRPPKRDAQGRVETPGLLACTLPAALSHLAPGHRVLFDEGRIEAVVTAMGKKHDFVLKVVRTQKQTVKLRAEKGINLPDTALDVPALTEADLEALRFVAKHADAVSLSFVRKPADVRKLHVELGRLGRPDLGVVLKIETKAAFESLPGLLLEGLASPPLGVMIARGDLAVEVGFERMAELQEEILWLCEACHVPAIWATQVLDTLTRTGIPARAEVTDAAASVAAECVMLNKGPYVADAVRALSDILRRMEKHHYKKRSLYRELSVSRWGEREREREQRAAGSLAPEPLQRR